MTERFGTINPCRRGTWTDVEPRPRLLNWEEHDHDNQTPTWDACYALSVERGSGPNKGGGDKVLSQYNRFMDECTAGKIPLGTDANASVGKLPAGARASTVVPKRINGRPVSAK